MTDGNAVGVCRENGMTVFCFGADTGETVSGTVIKVAPNYLVARTDRRPVSEKCPAYPVCGGCSLLHFSYERTLEIKQNHVRDCLERIGGFKDIKIDPIIPSPETEHFRNKAIYRFTKTNGVIRCGFYRRNSHDTVPSDSCACEKPVLRKVLSAVLDILNFGSYTVYDENSGKGLLRALMVRASTDGKAMVCLSVNAKSFPEGSEIASKLTAALQEVVSFYIHFNTSKTNTVLSGEFRLVSGRKTLSDRIGDTVFEISPESFFQVNPGSTVRLYDKAFEYAFHDRTGPFSLVDIYCGIGTIGLYFAKKCDNIKEILGIEYTEAAVLEAGRARENSGISAVTEFVSGDAGEVLENYKNRLSEKGVRILENADTVIVDPPRKGLGDNMPGIISSLKADRLVYISCNPATLARDLARFRDLSWEIKNVTPVDMFPFEGHVEIVVRLDRSRNSN